MKFFGQFLLERGAVDSEALLNVLAFLRHDTPPLCALAVEKGCFTPDQMADLDRQHGKTKRKHLTLAALNGMLTFPRLSALHAETDCGRWHFLAEALLETGDLSLVQMSGLLAAYRDERERASKMPVTGVDLADVPHRDVLLPVLRITLELFLRYTRQLVRITGVAVGEASWADDGHVFAQTVSGTGGFTYALALPGALTLSIARSMLQQEFAAVDDLVLDAVSEFVNVVVGNGCAQLGRALKLQSGPPQVLTPKMARCLLPKCVPIAVTMRTAKGEFLVMFYFE